MELTSILGTGDADLLLSIFDSLNRRSPVYRYNKSDDCGENLSLSKFSVNHCSDASA